MKKIRPVKGAEIYANEVSLGIYQFKFKVIQTDKVYQVSQRRMVGYQYMTVDTFAWKDGVKTTRALAAAEVLKAKKAAHEPTGFIRVDAPRNRQSIP